VDVPFNHAKSEIKFSEASALGVPTVASNIKPYSPVIEHGKTGFLAKTEKEWIDSLSKLIEDEKLRKEVGANARQWVEKNRDANKNYHLWVETYQAHLESKKALKSTK
jgi:glycosyltransferase involved in cell wall biosynthesis